MSQSYFEQGNHYYEIQRYSEALQAYQRELTEDPEDPECHVMMGWCHFSLRNMKEALASAKEAVRTGPDYSRSFELLGSLQHHQGKAALALKTFEEGLEHEPDDVSLLYRATLVAQELGDWKKARAFLEYALELEPENAKLHAAHSQMMTIFGKNQEGIDAALIAAKMDPESTEAHIVLGQVLRNKGDVASSIQAYRTALRLDPTDEEARQGLIEAARSRFFLYRWFTSYQLLIQRVPTNYRSLFFFIPLFGARLGRHLERGSVGFYICVALGVVYVFTLIMGFFAGLILDAIASFDRELRQVLTVWERRQALWVTSLLAMGPIYMLLSTLHRGFVISAIVTVLGFVLCGLLSNVQSVSWVKKLNVVAAGFWHVLALALAAI